MSQNSHTQLPHTLVCTSPHIASRKQWPQSHSPMPGATDSGMLAIAPISAVAIRLVAAVAVIRLRRTSCLHSAKPGSVKRHPGWPALGPVQSASVHCSRGKGTHQGEKGWRGVMTAATAAVTDACRHHCSSCRLTVPPVSARIEELTATAAQETEAIQRETVHRPHGDHMLHSNARPDGDREQSQKAATNTPVSLTDVAGLQGAKKQQQKPGKLQRALVAMQRRQGCLIGVKHIYDRSRHLPSRSRRSQPSALQTERQDQKT
jgi:hypothetical protein